MKKYKSDTALLIAICIPIVIFGILAGSVLYFYHCERQYKAFIRDLSASTAYAYEHNGIIVSGTPEAFVMTGNTGHDSFLVTDDMLYRPYQLLSGGGQGRPRYRLPKESSDLTIDFRDGSTLQIWNTPVKNAGTGDGYGILVRFKKKNGRAYSYDTDKIRFSQFSF